MAFSLYSSA
ncbi:hypothetical protein AYI68_g1437, partial [Smittium mucronatum]